MAVKTKQPSEALTFAYDFAAGLAGDTIASVDALAYDGPDSTLIESDRTVEDTRVLVRWAGGTAGVTYGTYVRVTSTNGEKLEIDGAISVLPVGGVAAVPPADYDLPSAAYLVAMYPAFASVPPATVGLHISMASQSAVDTSWLQVDYAPAIIAKAAHEMALLGLGTRTEAEGWAAAGLTRVRSGNFDAAFSESRVSRASGGTLEATPYGQAYKRLLRKNKGGPRLAGGAATGCGWGPTAQQNDGGILPWVC